MSDLFKEMCVLSGKLNDLIDDTKDIGERQKLMDTGRLIKDFNENKLKLINLFVHLIDIIANVEKILLGWKTSKKKKLKYKREE